MLSASRVKTPMSDPILLRFDIQQENGTGYRQSDILPDLLLPDYSTQWVGEYQYIMNGVEDGYRLNPEHVLDLIDDANTEKKFDLRRAYILGALQNPLFRANPTHFTDLLLESDEQIVHLLFHSQIPWPLDILEHCTLVFSPGYEAIYVHSPALSSLGRYRGWSEENYHLLLPYLGDTRVTNEFKNNPAIPEHIKVMAELTPHTRG